MNILLATDAFPPVCGGSGWSTFELARGLRLRGHTVTIVQPRPGTRAGLRETTYDELRVLEFGAPAPGMGPACPGGPRRGGTGVMRP